MQIPNEQVERLLRELPDEKAARGFLEQFAKEHPRYFQKLSHEPGLFSDMLALVAWSPLLATTIEQNPDYLSWISRERINLRVRTCEELKESLARFSLTNSSLNPQVLLARFRRRELLRICLHDIRGSHVMVETTEELSNLADAILDYALSLARQDLDNRYGSPRRTDERGRIGAADFCIVGMGKLGSLELNYSSDIDLFFLYSDEGTTSGSSERGEVSNREYFVRLSETIARLVGQPAGEGAAYRVDLRLRPHGRDGTLACSLEEAARYYRRSAQPWERQALIRARSCAGSASLFARFASAVRTDVFRPDVSVREALAMVRLAKQKINRKIERRLGFNVKLSPGGIREIEFIAQALQLAHGGRDEWLRVPHTLVSLGRLADRGFIAEHERTALSDAYEFLRKLEHRLQMEHGLQTHIVPENPAARALVARRMKFSTLEDFEDALNQHAGNVRRAYDRVFAEAEPASMTEDKPLEDPARRFKGRNGVEEDAGTALLTANIFLSHLDRNQVSSSTSRDADSLAEVLVGEAHDSLSPQRALSFAARVALSLDKSAERFRVTEDELRALIRLCGSSEFFGEMIAANPALIRSLSRNPSVPGREYRAILRSGIDAEKSFHAELSALRRGWSRLLIEIGMRDAAGEISIYESNRLQTELATASLNAAYLIARRETARRYGRLEGGPRLAIFGLGRLGSSGVDYGSDLDIIIVYDSLVPSPLASMIQDEAYARLSELMVAALSSVTREGNLYRVDLRLRPDGQSGLLAIGMQSLFDYLQHRSAVWEWLAYVKLRAVSGDLELGRMIETRARHIVHESARKLDVEELKQETRRVRDRLERDKARQGRRQGIDFKYGAGGMLDVYFATRYLQLRDDVADEGEDRSTLSTLDRLRMEGSLDAESYAALRGGYELLRAVDHQIRLIAGRSASLPGIDHPAARDIAKKLGLDSGEKLGEVLAERMTSIRLAYLRIVGIS